MKSESGLKSLPSSQATILSWLSNRLWRTRIYCPNSWQQTD